MSASIKSLTTASSTTSVIPQNGPNKLSRETPELLCLPLLKQFEETLILLLLTSAAISFPMGNLDDVISITIAFTIVAAVGFVQ